ncbi:hypothetical protein H3V02_05545 [Bifidobacterium sp. W8106]|nr:hypothetical protein [Bifidobacterium choladohabitans]MBI0147928.1 hypothetical protein [Bifidobacterium sp. W8104]
MIERAWFSTFSCASSSIVIAGSQPWQSFERGFVQRRYHANQQPKDHPSDGYPGGQVMPQQNEHHHQADTDQG